MIKQPCEIMQIYIERAIEQGCRFLPDRIYENGARGLPSIKHKIPTHQKNAEGKFLCGWCGGPVPSGRRYWCGEVCVKEFMIRRSSEWLSNAVYKRDKGICSECGIDTNEISGLKHLVFRRAHEYWDSARRKYDRIPAMTKWLPATQQEARRQWGPWGRTGTLWEAHHIVAVTEGGGCCGLDNMATLCIACHARETAELSRRTAEARRRAKGLPRQESLFEKSVDF